MNKKIYYNIYFSIVNIKKLKYKSKNKKYIINENQKPISNYDFFSHGF